MNKFAESGWDEGRNRIILLEHQCGVDYNEPRMQTALLENVSIVLVQAKTPANIGATARVMMNMGLHRLLLVRPPRDPGDEAVKLAAGARKILDDAVRCPSLREAVAGQGLVIGASRHRGRVRKNVGTPRETAERVVPLLARNKVCFVFGNEVNGLERADLALCHEFLLIPSSREFPSLNLSHAVMAVAYEFFLAAQGRAVPSEIQLAPAGELEDLYSHLQHTLQAIGFLDPTRSAQMMFSLRQIFGRAGLDSRDVRILRGILTAVDEKSGERLGQGHAPKI